MGGARRSRSAQAVAVERAVLTDLGAIDDPFAERLLDPTMARILWVIRHLVPARLRRRSVTLAGLAGRVRWHDDLVSEATTCGIDQVVIVGAGYDSRAWRMARPGVRFFEVDHPVTQDDKRSRSDSHGPTYAPADLRVDDAGSALARRGLDSTRPTAFVLEGLTMYLTEDAVRRLLRSLAAVAAPGSRLSVDFYPPQQQGTSQDRRQDALQRLARRGSGEGLSLTIERADAVRLLEAEGWRVTASAGARSAAERLVPAGIDLPVAAVNDRKSLVTAAR